MSTRAQTLRKATRQSSQLQNEVAQGQGTSLHASSSTEKEKLALSEGAAAAAAAAAVAAVKHDQDGPRKRETKAAHSRAKKVYCSCRQPDDGTPMILCSECKEWYHFRCLSLSERDAEDIQLFVCQSCQEKTGLRSVMEWEGPEALEERKTSAASKQKSATAGLPSGRTAKTRQGVSAEPSPRKKKSRIVKDEDRAEDTETSDDGSGDEYITEEEGAQNRVNAKGKRRAVAQSLDSDTDGSEGRTKSTAAKKARRLSAASAISSARTRTLSKSASPEPHTRRRKSSTTAAGEGLLPSLRRKRADTQSSQTPLSASGGGGEDAARKYCLSKLQDIFIDIFLKYPVLPDTGEREHNEQGEAAPEKTAEQLTEEEKEAVRERARRFATELEDCMFELYSEPDKTGKRSVAAKYKERFRMLSFNLSKPDRVALHKSISSSHITPRELSTMSSTDLANEETKQSIRQAEQAALAHSILKKTLLPRAKITHKGLEDIEDLNEDGRREEREREREEEERIERERQERLKLQAERKSAQTSGSVPPESPVTPHTPSWGGPPPVPMHAVHIGHGEGTRPPLNPLFIPTASEVATPAPLIEGELNLADLINIDEELGQEVSISLASDVRLSTPDTAAPLSVSTVPESPAQTTDVPSAASPPPTPTSSTGISPFASRASYPEGTPRRSFDLNAIWSAQASIVKEEAAAPASLPEESPREEDDGEPMTLDSPEETQIEPPLSDEGPGEASDNDFDMFLDDGEDGAGSAAQPEQTPETLQATFEALPRVWNGRLSMPLDSTIPQEVSVTAKQVGGRTLNSLSTAWRVLFPADHLRIDGRVAVDKSAQYLTQMRLNPSKELIAVTFSPDSESSTVPFDTLSKHLISKGRHGLIFPWGNRPKEHHPGRELYIVPLLSTEPIPDFIELLDELRLPANRSQSYLLGIWILTRGKLEAAAPPIPPPPEPAAPPPAGIPPPMPFSQLPLPLPISNAMHTPLPPAASQPPSVNTSALAAEVASLTPEQIQAMLRTLTATGAVPISSQPPPLPPPMASMPPISLQSLAPAPPIPSPSWLPGPTSYAPPLPYPPLSAPPHMQHPPPPPPPPYGSPRRYDKEPSRPPYGHDRDRDRDHEERGHRRGRSGRGRGRGQGQSQGQQERQRDSGWRGRARTRSQGQSQGRGQWRDGGGQQQQWN